MSQPKHPTIATYITDENVEILHLKLLGGRSLGRVADVLSAALRMNRVSEDLSITISSQFMYLVQQILRAEGLSSNILTLEFAIQKDEVLIGVRALLSPIKNPAIFKKKMEFIQTPVNSVRSEFVLHVKKLNCAWICHFPIQDQQLSKPESWEWTLTNSEYNESNKFWKNLGDINTADWTKEVGVFNGVPVEVSDQTVIPIGKIDVSVTDQSRIAVTGGISETQDQTRTVVTGEVFEVRDQTKIAVAAAPVELVDQTVVYSNGNSVRTEQPDARIIESSKLESDVPEQETLELGQNESVERELNTKDTHVEGSSAALLNPVDNHDGASSVNPEASEELRLLIQSNQGETNVEKLQENFSRMIRVLETEKNKVKALTERVIAAEKEAAIAKPKAKELESKLERAVTQIAQKQKDIDAVKIKVKQAEQEKNKVENELRAAKAQIATLTKRLAG